VAPELADSYHLPVAERYLSFFVVLNWQQLKASQPGGRAPER
jgi:hypothetical protein